MSYMSAFNQCILFTEPSSEESKENSEPEATETAAYKLASEVELQKQDSGVEDSINFLPPIKS